MIWTVGEFYKKRVSRIQRHIPTLQLTAVPLKADTTILGAIVGTTITSHKSQGTNGRLET